MDWNILRDSIWGSIGAIAGILALIVTIINVILFILERRKKGLGYEILTISSLISPKEKVNGRFKILFDGIEVEDIQFMEIQVKNTGNIAITSQDYENPLKFIFPQDVRLLIVEVIKLNPVDLPIEFEVDKNTITFKPMLLNSKDFFTIKIITSTPFYGGDVIITTRIKDVKEIKKGKVFNFMILGWQIIGLVLILFIQLILKNIYKSNPSLLLIEMIFLLFALAYLIYFFYTIKKEYKNMITWILGDINYISIKDLISNELRTKKEKNS